MSLYKKKRQYKVDADVSARNIEEEFSSIQKSMPTTVRSYTPTIGAGGAMTISAVSISKARWCVVGNMLLLDVIATFTTDGFASDTITLSVPPEYLMLLGVNGCAGSCSVTDTDTRPGTYASTSTTTITIKKGDLSNFGLGANRGIGIQLFYELNN